MRTALPESTHFLRKDARFSLSALLWLSIQQQDNARLIAGGDCHSELPLKQPSVIVEPDIQLSFQRFNEALAEFRNEIVFERSHGRVVPQLQARRITVSLAHLAPIGDGGHQQRVVREQLFRRRRRSLSRGGENEQTPNENEPANACFARRPGMSEHNHKSCAKGRAARWVSQANPCDGVATVVPRQRWRAVPCPPTPDSRQAARRGLRALLRVLRARAETNSVFCALFKR